MAATQRSAIKNGLLTPLAHGTVPFFDVGQMLARVNLGTFRSGTMLSAQDGKGMDLWVRSVVENKLVPPSPQSALQPPIVQNLPIPSSFQSVRWGCTEWLGRIFVRRVRGTLETKSAKSDSDGKTCFVLVRNMARLFTQKVPHRTEAHEMRF